ncbi:MAG: helix-turn-helix transcriptional regulator [Candidatus Gastranaerophilales bacterium]|nr:helix-turn-helix transcriptional regulator [Candidatus Gastranaerophilales bacterium]
MSTQGSRLKEFRETLRLSQADLANSLGIAGPSITKVEKDKNNLSNENLVKLATIYNLNINWLLINKGDMFIKENAANVSDEFKGIIKAEVVNLLHEYGLTDVIK